MEVHLRPFTVFWFFSCFYLFKNYSSKERTARQTEIALQFTIILERAVIIYGQLSDSDIQLTTTCLWPVIRACLSDSPLLTWVFSNYDMWWSLLSKRMLCKEKTEYGAFLSVTFCAKQHMHMCTCMHVKRRIHHPAALLLLMKKASSPTTKWLMCD